MKVSQTMILLQTQLIYFWCNMCVDDHHVVTFLLLPKQNLNWLFIKLIPRIHCIWLVLCKYLHMEHLLQHKLL